MTYFYNGYSLNEIRNGDGLPLHDRMVLTVKLDSGMSTCDM